MTFEELSERQQEALLQHIIYFNLEPTPELIEELSYQFSKEVLFNAPTVVYTNNGIMINSITQISQLLQEEVAKELYNQILDMANEVEEDLVIINYNMACSPLCLGAQNKVYSISGKSKKYPRLEDYTCQTNGYTNGKALFHRFCKHWISVYYEGESDDPVEEISKKDSEELYKLQQADMYTYRNQEKFLRDKIELENLNMNSDKKTKIYKQWKKRRKQTKKEFNDYLNNLK